MPDLSTTLHQGFRYHFTDFYTRVHTLAADLTEEEFWQNPFPYGNSIGHLVLHLTGNLNYDRALRIVPLQTEVHGNPSPLSAGAAQ